MGRLYLNPPVFVSSTQRDGIPPDVLRPTPIRMSALPSCGQDGPTGTPIRSNMVGYGPTGTPRVMRIAEASTPSVTTAEHTPRPVTPPTQIVYRAASPRARKPLATTLFPRQSACVPSPVSHTPDDGHQLNTGPSVEDRFPSQAGFVNQQSNPLTSHPVLLRQLPGWSPGSSNSPEKDTAATTTLHHRFQTP